MKQRMRDVKVLKHNTKVLCIYVCLLAIGPVFCTLAFATGAHALSLRGVIKDITAPIVYVTPSGTALPPTAAPSSSSKATPVTQTPAPTERTATTNASASSGTAAYGPPLELVPTLAQDLQQATLQPRYNAQLVVAHSPRTMQDSSFALLQPSKQGWQIAGIAWYWWVLAGTVVWLGARMGQRFLQRRAAQKALAS